MNAEYEITWSTTADELADRCPNGTPGEIRAALKRISFDGTQVPELVDETLVALAERGRVEIIRSPLLG